MVLVHANSATGDILHAISGHHRLAGHLTSILECALALRWDSFGLIDAFDFQGGLFWMPRGIPFRCWMFPGFAAGLLLAAFCLMAD